MRSLSLACCAAMLALVLAACSSDPPPPTPAARPAPPPPPVDEEVVADGEVDVEAEIDEEEEERPPEYVYSPIGKRDPFRSPFLDLVAMEEARDRAERLTPLQKWDLDQLTVRAIISATADPMAMVLDPEGHGHVVRRGVLIGRNWGRVTAIRRECLVITEQMRDATGTPMAVQQERCLPKDEREARFEEQIRRQLQ